MIQELVFYYDVICPYAYLASKLIKNLSQRNGVKLLWRPVLLGGIYKATKHEGMNIPDNKMILTYGNQKRKILLQDLAMMYARYKIPISRFTVPDVRTLNAMRLIASTPDESSDLRENLTHSIYDAFWLYEQDVSDPNVLQAVANKLNYEINVEEFLNNKTHSARQTLLNNTEEAVKRGAFGVPGIWVNNRLYFGSDRLFMVERELGNREARPHRILNKPLADRKKSKLTVYYDFASPWTYLAITQVAGLIESVRPLEVDLEYVPVLIGVIFKELGTPGVPLQAMGENKRNYQFQDFQDWLKYYAIKDFRFSSHFPLNTLTALRMAIANPDPRMIRCIFDAVWCKNVNISDQESLTQLLSESGFHTQSLLNDSQKSHVKMQLRNNTQRALDNGVCGLPSFQVNNGPIVYGQDRMNVVADMLLGWDFSLDFINKISKL